MGAGAGSVHGAGERALAFLILLLIATAVLLAWLLVAVTRFTIGDLRVRWVHPSPAQPTPSDAIAEPPAIVAAPDAVPTEAAVEDDADAERVVREHLYGRGNRRT